MLLLEFDACSFVSELVLLKAPGPRLSRKCETRICLPSPFVNSTIKRRPDPQGVLITAFSYKLFWNPLRFLISSALMRSASSQSIRCFPILSEGSIFYHHCSVAFCLVGVGRNPPTLGKMISWMAINREVSSSFFATKTQCDCFDN